MDSFEKEWKNKLTNLNELQAADIQIPTESIWQKIEQTKQSAPKKSRPFVLWATHIAAGIIGILFSGIILLLNRKRDVLPNAHEVVRYETKIVRDTVFLNAEKDAVYESISESIPSPSTHNKYAKTEGEPMQSQISGSEKETGTEPIETAYEANNKKINIQLGEELQRLDSNENATAQIPVIHLDDIIDKRQVKEKDGLFDKIFSEPKLIKQESPIAFLK